MTITSANFSYTGTPSAADLAKSNQALIYLQGSPLAANELQTMLNAGPVTIDFNPVSGGPGMNFAARTIFWNPNVGLIYNNASFDSDLSPRRAYPLAVRRMKESLQ